MLYDLSTNKQNTIYNTHGSPGGLLLSGNRIIFGDRDFESGTFAKHMYDFSTKEEINLPFDYRPDAAFYGNKVIYNDWRYDNLDIFRVQI